MKDGFRLQGCSEHNLCRNCATAYVQTYINNGGAVREMTCPIGDECQVQFSPLDVRRLDPEQGEGPLFQRYIKFFKQQSGKHAPCPKCGFLNEGSPEQTVKMQCKECSTKYCFHHGNQHDPNKETCDQYLRRTAQAQQETDRIIQTTTSECPGCGALINKTRGCNHVRAMQRNAMQCNVIHLVATRTPRLMSYLSCPTSTQSTTLADGECAPDLSTSGCLLHSPTDVALQLSRCYRA